MLQRHGERHAEAVAGLNDLAQDVHVRCNVQLDRRESRRRLRRHRYLLRLKVGHALREDGHRAQKCLEAKQDRRVLNGLGHRCQLPHFVHDAGRAVDLKAPLPRQSTGRTGGNIHAKGSLEDALDGLWKWKWRGEEGTQALSDKEHGGGGGATKPVGREKHIQMPTFFSASSLPCSSAISFIAAFKTIVEESWGGATGVSSSSEEALIGLKSQLGKSCEWRAASGGVLMRGARKNNSLKNFTRCLKTILSTRRVSSLL